MGGGCSCLETIEMGVVMGIDKATHVREAQSAETDESSYTKGT